MGGGFVYVKKKWYLCIVIMIQFSYGRGTVCFVGCSKGTCFIKKIKFHLNLAPSQKSRIFVVMNSRTYISDLKPRHLNRVIDLTLAWCVKMRGYKKHKGIPSVRVSLAKVESQDTYGYYCAYLNEIVLYKETLKDYTVRKLIMVIIHEYTHSLQKIKQSYDRMYDKFGYWDHPMEIEARKSESTWNLCYRDIKGDLLG